MENIRYKYDILCKSHSDIFEHLPTLSKYASDCDSVLELGVRGCISSWALANGLLENNSNTKKLFLNDITDCNIDELKTTIKDTPIELNYKWINDLQLEVDSPVDMVFIDTWHVYGQLKRELNKFSKVTKKYIIMHDTTLDEIYGETLRVGWDPVAQSLQSGIPVEEITCGLWRAIEEFLQNNPNWKLKERYTNNNGLTVLVNTN